MKILTDRQSNIDVVKGVAIFLMLWGHVIQYCAVGTFDFFENSVFKVIYSFHMPLFMLVSGYLFFYSLRKRSKKEIVDNRIHSVFIPLVVCNAMIYAFTTLVRSAKENGLVKATFSGAWLNSLSGLWILWSILAASLVLIVAYKVVKNKIVRGIIFVAGCAFVLLFPNAQLNLFMYPYFFAKYKEIIPARLVLIKYAFLLIFSFLIVFYQKKHYIYTTGLFYLTNGLIECLVIDSFRWAIGLCGSVSTLVIVENLTKYVKTRTIEKAFASLGKKSLQIYILSCIFVSCYLPRLYTFFVDMAGANFLAQNKILYNLVYTPIIAGIFAVLLYSMTYALEKMKISYLLFGR